MKNFKVTYINKALGNKVGYAGYECESEAEVREKFAKMHRSFCVIQTVEIVRIGRR